MHWCVQNPYCVVHRSSLMKYWAIDSVDIEFCIRCPNKEEDDQEVGFARTHRDGDPLFR